ncbi:MAG: septum formation initiator family protein [Alphaproteobacteria bacterium]|nr:MAG: septum formation initiator family protein [Alphaproteobacteria bacterium]
MFLREIRRRTQRLIWPIFGAGIFMYFAYHLVSGSRGFLAWRNLTNHVELRRIHLDELRTEEQHLQHRVSLLKGKTASHDLISERAKASLGLALPDEIMIVYDTQPRT